MARSDIMDYITIASTGNASDFGDLLSAITSGGGTDNNSRGIYAGAYDGGRSNVMQFITIDSTGNASDFGDLTVGRSDLGSLSGNA